MASPLFGSLLTSAASVAVNRDDALQLAQEQRVVIASVLKAVKVGDEDACTHPNLVRREDEFAVYFTCICMG